MPSLMLASGEDADLPVAPRQYSRVAGILAVLAVTTTQVGTTQLTKRSQDFVTTPFYVMYLHTAPLVVNLPLARLLGGACVVAPPRPLALLLPLWVAASYFYVCALQQASPSLVQTVYGSAPAAAAVLSRAFLAEGCDLRRTLAVLLAFLGVAVVGLGGARDERQDGGNAFGGAVFAAAAVLAAAGYKVGFKACLGTPGPAAVLGFLGSMGAVVAVVGAPVAAAVATWDASARQDRWWRTLEEHPAGWAWLLGGAACDVLYGFLLTLAVAMTSPVFVAFGVILGIPANFAIDLCTGQPFSWSLLCGAALVVASFAALVTGTGPSAQQGPAAGRPACREAARNP